MLIKGIMTTMSGSVGGVTGAHNKGGMYLRARAPVTNPNTQAQQRAREDFSIAIAEWGLLTPAQRQNWNDFGAQAEHTNRVGDTIQLSGQQWFIAMNSALRSAGLDEVSDPPAPNTKPDPYPLYLPDVFRANNTDINMGPEINFAAGEMTADDRYVIALGGPVGPGLTYYAGPYRIQGTLPGNVAAADVTEGIYTELFTRNGEVPLPDGSRYAVQIRAVRDDGYFSAFSRRLTGPTVTPGP